jgi:hypothetical protein
MAEMKTLWIFGDSYSYGYELTKGHPYYKYKKEEDASYVSHLGKHFQMKVENYATPGWGNINILHDLLRNSPKISKEDIVIVGTSESARTQSFEYAYDKSKVFQASFGYKFDDHDFNKSTQEVHTQYPSSMENYILNCKLPLLEYHLCYELSMILNTLELIKCSKKILWTSNNWGKFESITTHTNSKIDDGHWSFNGHRVFSEYLIEKSKNTNFFIDPELTNIQTLGKYYNDPLERSKKLSIL